MGASRKKVNGLWVYPTDGTEAVLVSPGDLFQVSNTGYDALGWRHYNSSDDVLVPDGSCVLFLGGYDDVNEAGEFLGPYGLIWMSFSVLCGMTGNG